MSNKTIEYIRGPLFWAKVLGDPVDNYEKTGREWTFDLSLNKDALNQMKNIKVQGKPVKNIKNRDDERGDFVQFRQKYREPEEYERYGNKVRTVAEQRIKVMDKFGNDWDQNVKIGNGTIADVKFEVVDYGKGKYAGVYPRAIRIVNHIPYESQEFAPLSEEDEFFSKESDAEVKLKKDDMKFRDEFLGHTASDDLDDEMPL